MTRVSANALRLEEKGPELVWGFGVKGILGCPRSSITPIDVAAHNDVRPDAQSRPIPDAHYLRL
jgi:hypothetical protein